MGVKTEELGPGEAAAVLMENLSGLGPVARRAWGVTSTSLVMRRWPTGSERRRGTQRSSFANKPARDRRSVASVRATSSRRS